jgi:hypothetical protein
MDQGAVYHSRIDDRGLFEQEYWEKLPQPVDEFD